MLLVSTLIPALIILLFLWLIIFNKIDKNFLKGIITVVIGIAFITAGGMHLILIGVFIITLGWLWIYIADKLNESKVLKYNKK